MGLLFASRRTWIDPESLGMILAEDEYRQLGGLHEAYVGDIVVYRDSEGDVAHVAVIIELEPVIQTASWKVTVISKWGADGEYVHPLDELPDRLGSATEYWADRRLAP